MKKRTIPLLILPLLALTSCGSIDITEIEEQVVPTINVSQLEHIVNNRIPTEEELLNGVTATCAKDGNLNEDIKMDVSNVDWNNEGNYAIIYSVTNSQHNKRQVNRHVKVTRDKEAPVITLLVDSLDYYIGDDRPIYRDQNLISISDNRDLDISIDDITIDDPVDYETPGCYVVTFSATDTDLNTASAYLNVTVIKPAPKYAYPEIRGVSDKSYSMSNSTNENNSFLLYGVSATCNIDGNITDKIKISHNIDFNTPEKYVVTYSVKNAADMETVKTCVVTVVDDTAPGIYILVDRIDYYIGDEIPNYRNANYVNVTNSRGTVDLNDIEIIDNVNYEVEGTYYVTYKIIDEYDNEVSEDLKVVVIEPTIPYVEPEIRGVKNKTYSMNNPISDIDAYLMTGVSAIDSIDGNITDKIHVSHEINFNAPGNYIVTYSVTNLGGLSTSVTCTVTVIDDVKPTLNIPTSTITIPYSKEGIIPTISEITALDNISNNMELKYEGLDTKVAGYQTITVSVTDEAGNRETGVANVFIKFNNGLEAYEYATEKLYSYLNYQIVSSGNTFTQTGSFEVDVSPRSVKTKVGNQASHENIAKGVKGTGKGNADGGVATYFNGSTIRTRTIDKVDDSVQATKYGSVKEMTPEQYKNDYGILPHETNYIVNESTVKSIANFSLSNEIYSFKMALKPEAGINFGKMILKSNANGNSSKAVTFKNIDITSSIDAYGNFIKNECDESYIVPVKITLLGEMNADTQSLLTETFTFDNNPSTTLTVKSF